MTPLAHRRAVEFHPGCTCRAAAKKISQDCLLLRARWCARTPVPRRQDPRPPSVRVGARFARSPPSRSRLLPAGDRSSCRRAIAGRTNHPSASCVEITSVEITNDSKQQQQQIEIEIFGPININGPGQSMSLPPSKSIQLSVASHFVWPYIQQSTVGKDCVEITINENLEQQMTFCNLKRISKKKGHTTINGEESQD